MGVFAVIVDGKWTAVDDGQPPKPNPHVQPPKPDPPVQAYTQVEPMSDVDEIVGHLGQVVGLAQGLSSADARRVRDLFHAAQGMLSATTFLEKSDQKLFEKSLREGKR